MKTFITWLIWIPLLVIFAFLAIHNSSFMQIDLWPLDYTMTIPMALFGFAFFAIGYLAGAVITRLKTMERSKSKP